MTLLSITAENLQHCNQILSDCATHRSHRVCTQAQQNKRLECKCMCMNAASELHIRTQGVMTSNQKMRYLLHLLVPSIFSESSSTPSARASSPWLSASMCTCIPIEDQCEALGTTRMQVYYCKFQAAHIEHSQCDLMLCHVDCFTESLLAKQMSWYGLTGTEDTMCG